MHLTAHLNIEGPHESLRVCNFFKLWTEIAFLPLISLFYSFSLAAREKKKNQAGSSQTPTEAVLHLIQNNVFCLLICPGEAGLFPPFLAPIINSWVCIHTFLTKRGVAQTLLATPKPRLCVYTARIHPCCQWMSHSCSSLARTLKTCNALTLRFTFCEEEQVLM